MGDDRAARVGANVRRLREGRGWSLGQMHLRSGVSVSTQSQTEHAVHAPRLHTLLAIADALGVHPAVLLMTEAEARAWLTGQSAPASDADLLAVADAAGVVRGA